MRAACIEGWVRRRALRGVFVEALLALFSLVGGAVVVLITFCTTYLAILLLVNWFLPHSHATRWHLSLAFVAVLFMLNPWANRRPVAERPETEPDDSGEGFPRDLAALLRFADMDGIDRLLPRSDLRIIAHALCAGPRILLGTGAHLHAAYRLATVDVPGCAEVVALLLESDSKVPLATVRSGYRGLGFSKTLCDLRYLGAVLFLVKPPAGLLLSSVAREELEEELTEVCG